MAEDTIKCPACGGSEFSRANKDTGRIGYLLLVLGAVVILFKRLHPASLLGLAMLIAGAGLLFKTGQEFHCEKCGAKWK